MLTKSFRVYTRKPIESNNAQISDHLTRQHAHCLKCNPSKEYPTIKSSYTISQIRAMFFCKRCFMQSHIKLLPLCRERSPSHSPPLWREKTSGAALECRNCNEHDASNLAISYLHNFHIAHYPQRLNLVTAFFDNSLLLKTLMCFIVQSQIKHNGREYWEIDWNTTKIEECVLYHYESAASTDA